MSEAKISYWTPNDFAPTYEYEHDGEKVLRVINVWPIPPQYGKNPDGSPIVPEPPTDWHTEYVTANLPDWMPGGRKHH